MPILYCHHESGHSSMAALALSAVGVAWLERIGAQSGWHSPYHLPQHAHPIRTGNRT